MTWILPPSGNLDNHPEVLPLFVYGTLRVGGDEHSRLSHLIEGYTERALVRGELHHHTDGNWPVLTTGDRLVIGDIVPVRAGAELWDLLCSYELAWGYSLTWLPREDNSGRLLTCTWEWAYGTGPLIASGDWIKQN